MYIFRLSFIDVTELEKECLENGLKLNVFKEEWTTLMICKM